MSRRLAVLAALTLRFVCSAETPPSQPIAFSHRQHATAALLQCKDCHRIPAKFGDTPGLPAASGCMSCHRTIGVDRPEIRKLARYAASGEPIPWVRIAPLPSFAFFDHRFHLLNDATCADCHGPVAERDVLSNETKINKMSTCQGCHSKTEATNRCDACHNLRSIR